MATIAQTTAVPVGVVKQFGPYGPEYQVFGPAEPENRRPMAKIVLVRTGEEVDYPLHAILEDMDAPWCSPSPSISTPTTPAAPIPGT